MADALVKDTVGLLTFSLAEEDGTIVEATTDERLFAYLHGHENLPTVLEGQSAGARFDETVANAFGAPSGQDPQPVPKKALPKEVRDQAAPGLAFYAQGGQGQAVTLWITAVKGSRVWVTTDHPLAGKTLRFQGEVQRVREATASELEHGHAHGAHGHQHQH